MSEKKIESALSAEQQARDMLERMHVDDAQCMTNGDVVELANLIASHDQLSRRIAEVEPPATEETLVNVVEKVSYLIECGRKVSPPIDMDAVERELAAFVVKYRARITALCLRRSREILPWVP